VVGILRYNQRLKGRTRSLRSNLTDAEQHLWGRLRRKQLLGVQFYRQKPIGNYIADFYAPAAQLVVEVDGSQHAEPTQAEHDNLRTAYLTRVGLRVLRYTDRQVLLEMDSVVEDIFRAVEKKIPLKRGNILASNSVQFLDFSGLSSYPSLKKRGEGRFCECTI
jgi:very-short-patch-repair endonuclease